MHSPMGRHISKDGSPRAQASRVKIKIFSSHAHTFIIILFDRTHQELLRKMCFDTALEVYERILIVH